jgi:hypothetical protein
MKKIYKMTEDQVANLITNRKNSVSETSSPKETKKKYKITEEQLKRIFSELGKKVVGEMDNYNYPMGSDTSDAPWNQDDGNVRQGESVSGNFVGFETADSEYLLKDKQSNQLYYTLNDVWYDIHGELEDYLDIPQEEAEDEDGRYSTNIDDWRYVIEDTELLDALSSYMNYQSKKGGLKIANDVDTWEDAEQEFLIVKPETLEAIGSKTLREKAKQLNNSF